MSGFGAMGKFDFLSLFVKQLEPRICCVLHSNHKCTVFAKPRRNFGLFLCYLRQNACICHEHHAVFKLLFLLELADGGIT